MMPIPRLRRAPPPRLRVLAALLAATLAPLPALAAARLDGIAMSLEELAEVRILAELERAVARDGEQAREPLRRWQEFERGWFAVDRTRARCHIVETGI